MGELTDDPPAAMLAGGSSVRPGKCTLILGALAIVMVFIVASSTLHPAPLVNPPMAAAGFVASLGRVR